MVDIEQLKRKELSAWFEDFKAQIAQKEDIVFVDDGTGNEETVKRKF